MIDILRTCHQLGVPVVAGAGTGLSGGRCRTRRAWFCRWRVSTAFCTSTATAAAPSSSPACATWRCRKRRHLYGLYYAPDPSSQIACTLGGNVAENSGGVHCLKYGLTVHNVLRLRVVSIEGEVFEIGSAAPDAPGYDLLALLIGSEGMLGVVTEVTVKLVPKPELAQVVMASFDDVARAGDAVAAIIAAGIIPAGLEMMDKPATAAVEPLRQGRLRPRRGGHPAVRGGRHAGRGGRGDRARHRGVDGCRRPRHPRLRSRGRAPALLGRAQGGVSGGRAHHAGLLLHGRHDSRKRLAEMLSAIGEMEGNTACAAPTSSMPATATCIR